MPPVRNFLVENIDGKWLYWGLIHIIEVKHDYINKTTSGKFKIIYINKNDMFKLLNLNISFFVVVKLIIKLVNINTL